MSDERNAARNVIHLVANNPDAMNDVATLAAAIDALATLYRTNPNEHLTSAQRAMRSPVAVWRTIHAHVEHRNKHP